jgi:hypothetical protein
VLCFPAKTKEEFMRGLVIITLSLTCSAAFADIEAGYTDIGTHLWNDPCNWSWNYQSKNGNVPDSFAGVIGGMRNGDICNIVSGDNAVCSYLYWGWSTPATDPTTNYFNVSGTGTLTVSGSLFNAVCDANVVCYMTLSGDAVVNVGGEFEVVQFGKLGYLRIKDNAVLIAATVSVTTANAGVTGHVQLDGGVLQATSVFQMSTNNTPCGTFPSIDCNGGVLKVPMSYRGTVQTYINSGLITAKGKTGLDKFLIGTDGATYYSFQAIPDANLASNPNPAYGATRIPLSTVLSWLAGSHATAHNVFLGTDSNAVTNASAIYIGGDLNKDGKVDINDLEVLAAHWLEPDANGTNFAIFASLAQNWLTESVFKGRLSAASYVTSGLQPGQTYYWRVDEVNENLPQSPWKGPVWNFSTPSGVAQSVYYVSTTGSNNNPGTYDQPFGSLEKARDVLRQLTLPAGGVTVYLRGGNYYRTGSFALTGKDSGGPNSPIVYQAYPGETPRIIGGISVDPNWFTLCTPTSPTAAIWNRIDPNAQGKVYWLNMASHGITNYGVLVDRGGGLGDTCVSALEVSFNGQMMTLSQWPNTGQPWARTVSGLSDTSFKYSGTRPSRWKVADNLWIHGFFNFGWIDHDYNISSILTTTSTITWTTDYGAVPGSNMPWCVYNSLEELDTPGEWYLNTSGTSRMYFWPPSPLAGSEILFSMLNDPLVNMDSTTSYVSFNGITFECCRGKGIVVGGGSGNHILNCTIRNIGSTGIRLAGNNSSIENCQIHDLGNGGVVVAGGDRYALVPCNNLVKNCNIYNYGRWGQTYYNVGILINYACGVHVCNNAIHNGPGEALSFWGNNNLIELNEFYGNCTNIGDGGVIYDGQGWANRGNIVKNNFFHDNSSLLFGAGGIQNIYFDDCTSGNSVTGNIFYNSNGRATFNGGGHYNTWTNNVMALCYLAHWGDARGTNWESPSIPGYEVEVESYDYNQPPWSISYPELITIMSLPLAQAEAPQGVIFASNIGYQNTTWTSSDGLAFNYYTWGTNITNQDPLFYDQSNEVLALQDNSPAYTLPGFQRIPWEKMGNLLVDKASRPVPPSNWASATAAGLNLYWAPALTAASHIVYLSTNPNPRLDAAKGTFTDSPCPTGVLQTATTYYWCVDEYDGKGSLMNSGDIWSFKTK